MELIEREAAIEVLEHAAEYYSRIDDCTEHAIRQCISTVKKVPTIDAAPVRRGRWIECDDDIYTWIKCSECGFEQDIDDCGEHPHEVEDYILCPACGARMDGGKGHGL